MKGWKLQLGRFLIKQKIFSRKQILRLFSLKKIKVDGQIILSRHFLISQFNEIKVNEKIIQSQKIASYYMMNKAAGILSATKDLEHKTVMDVMQEAGYETMGLHIAGRLDRSTTGLILLTNDGKWSRKITEPNNKIAKVYLVTLAYPISPETPLKFQQGIYFTTENITTQPAQIEYLTKFQYRLTIYEGCYHQVKRMFSAVGNRVIALHRESVGNFHLPLSTKQSDIYAISRV